MEAGTDIDRRVIALLAAQAMCDADGLTRATPIEALGIDSMGLAELLFALEEEFDIAVPFNANTPEAGGLDLRTVGSVCDAVRRLLEGQGP